MSDSRFHSRDPSPAVGTVEARVPSSEPGGPSRIWVVAAVGSSFRSPATTSDPLATLVGHQAGRVDADTRRLGGATVQRVHGVPGALVLVARAEPATGERQQLRLQVHRHHVDVDARRPCTRARSAGRPSASRVLPSSSTCTGATRAGNRSTCSSSTGAVAGRARRPGCRGRRARPGRVPGAGQPGHQVVEGPGRADLLHGEHVEREPVDHPRQRPELRLVRRPGRWAVRPVGGPEQVLQVPGAEPHARKAIATGRRSARCLAAPARIARMSLPP